MVAAFETAMNLISGFVHNPVKVTVGVILVLLFGVLAMVMLVQTGPRRKATAEEVMPAAGLASLPLPHVVDCHVAKPLAADGKRSEPRPQSLAS